MIYSDKDFENLFLRYKAEGLPRKETVNAFCIKNGVPFNKFDKWYRDTRHRVVPVRVDGRTGSDGDENEAALQEAESTYSDPSADDRPLRIMIDIRMSNGTHLSRRNMSYDELRAFVERLEALCYGSTVALCAEHNSSLGE